MVKQLDSLLQIFNTSVFIQFCAVFYPIKWSVICIMQFRSKQCDSLTILVFYFLQVAGASVFARPSPIECTDGGCAVPGWEDVAMRTSTRVIPLGWKWTRHRRHKKRKTDGACLFTAPNASRIIWLRDDGVSRTFQRGLMIPVRHRHYWGHADLCPRRRNDLAPIPKRRCYPSHLFWQTHLWDENWTVTDWTLTKSVPVCLFLFFLRKKKGVKLQLSFDSGWLCLGVWVTPKALSQVSSLPLSVSAAAWLRCRVRILH